MLVTTQLHVECVCVRGDVNWYSLVLIETVTDYTSPMVGNNVVLTADLCWVYKWLVCFVPI